MVITQLVGGLGNQMFQYAVGRALSLARGVPLRLDVSAFSMFEIHQGFELERVFSGRMEVAEPADVHSVLGWQSSTRVLRLFSRAEMQFARSAKLIVEPSFNYFCGIRDITVPCYLKGYWQSERYFSDVAQTIRDDFTFRVPPSGRNFELARHIDGVNAVSLHIRRGDYSSNPKTLAMHGLCSLKYYAEAIDLVVDRIPEPMFFVFSDDMHWVQANLHIGYPCEYIDHNRGAESYNDMRLMSLCKHHIIANSSFSWWGAWLNPGVTKLVVAPRQWFTNPTSVEDLLPAGWIKL